MKVILSEFTVRGTLKTNVTFNYNCSLCFGYCAEFCNIVLVISHPLSSNRQHLSYDVCLEVRGKIIRTVLCCIVY